MEGARSAATLVVKVGGSCLDDLAPEWWDDLARLAGGGRGENRAAAGGDAAGLVVVHGWSKMLAGSAPAGQPEFVVDKHGFRSRYTTPAVLERIEAVAADLRERIADLLRARGLRARAVSGADERLLRAVVRPNMWWVGDELVELTNLVGPVRAVDAERLTALRAGVDALVVSPLAVADGHPRVNTDADRAAAALAGAAGAPCLALAMEAPAVLVDGAPLARASRAELPSLARHAKGGMAKKLRAVEEAFAGGVESVAVGNAPASELVAGRAGTLIAGSGGP